MPTLRLSNAQIYYVKMGKGRPLVFIHGLFMDHHTWRHVAARLRSQYQLYAYDLRGHGGSPRNGTPVTLQQLVDDLHLFLEAESIRNPVLIGYSIGTAVALLYAVRYPGRVAGLILSGSFADSDASFLRLDFALSKLACKLGIKDVIANVVAKANASSATEFGLFLRLIRQCDLTACLEILECVKNYDVKAQLHTLQIPVLLIYGSREKGLFRREVQELTNLIPQSTTVVIPGVSHAVAIKKSQEFTTAIREFLKTNHLEHE